jgi:four helix bundle protein
MPAPQFDHEKLDVYQLQLQFIGWLADLFEELQLAKPRRVAETLDQLDRASLSVLLNIAEGNGRRPSQQRVRFFDDARGSVTECAACLDALVAKRAANVARVTAGKALLIRVISILTKLVALFEGKLDDESAPGLSSRSRSRRTRTI